MTGRRCLIPLKTRYEVETTERLVDAHVVEIPVKLAEIAVRILRSFLLANDVGTRSFYFLRRLVPTSHLPPHLRDDVKPREDCSTIHLLIPSPLESSPDRIIASLQPHINLESMPVMRTTQVPREAPTTAEQAAHWSQSFWPCTFNPASQVLQKAPPLHVLREVLAELNNLSRLESYFRLAGLAAIACTNYAVGRGIAAVVVNPLNEEVIAVAGDARWASKGMSQRNGESCQGRILEGRPEQHALLRAIAMVAWGEHRRSHPEAIPSTVTDVDNDNLGATMLTPIEKMYAAIDTATSPQHTSLSGLPKRQFGDRPDAYLCSGLDVYLTHEPCVACSMAMVHSRFRACVFQTKMPQSGGLCADKSDGEPSYGLFWRKELNWRVLTFQYVPSAEKGLESDATSNDYGAAHPNTNFHA